LVGGGDPTLTAAPPGQPGSYVGAARVSTLAVAVKKSGAGPVTRVVVDGSRFSGPTLAPGWDGDVVSGGDVAPITAATVDGGRTTPGYRPRSTTPDLLAGRVLAADLGAPQAPVSRGEAPAGARVLARVQSPPLTVMLQQMLTASDNALAEYLGRAIAIAKKQPASFAGAAAAVRSEILAAAKADPGQLTLADASGLSRDDRISPATVTTLLRFVAGTPTIRPILGDLPVAGYTGTLAERFRAAPAATAGGVLRAKTGTLTGVSSLAGVVQDRDGRVLAFAFMIDRGGGTPDVEAALDIVAGRLAGCGCR
jgi:D-alanyl-D-alanine carboxypeptidase/D-alanyl-D-alanine-endopeptidase (penicillin-binding protein 4)